MQQNDVSTWLGIAASAVTIVGLPIAIRALWHAEKQGERALQQGRDDLELQLGLRLRDDIIANRVDDQRQTHLLNLVWSHLTVPPFSKDVLSGLMVHVVQISRALERGLITPRSVLFVLAREELREIYSALETARRLVDELDSRLAGNPHRDVLSEIEALIDPSWRSFAERRLAATNPDFNSPSTPDQVRSAEMRVVESFRSNWPTYEPFVATMRSLAT